MADLFQFPRNGYQVEVLRKEDIINTIDNFIIDKDLALDIIKKCEQDAITYLKQDKWVSIPFIGSIKIPETVKTLNDKKSQEILNSAKEELDKEKYILFRRSFSGDVGKRVKANRYQEYIASKFATNNKSFYKRLIKRYGEHIANLLCYTLSNMKEVK